MEQFLKNISQSSWCLILAGVFLGLGLFTIFKGVREKAEDKDIDLNVVGADDFYHPATWFIAMIAPRIPSFLWGTVLIGIAIYFFTQSFFV